MMETKVCNICGPRPLSDFNYNSKKNKPGTRRYRIEGPRQRRAKCKDHEKSSRLRAKRVKLKTSKNIIATNGGNCPSPQKVKKKPDDKA